MVYVDDEKTILDLFSQLACVKYAHWLFETRNNPAKLFDEVQRGRFASRVWIIDMMMPGRNGAELAEAIRKSALGKDAVIYGYTAIDRSALEGRPEFRGRLDNFTEIISKRQDFIKLLANIDEKLKIIKKSATKQPAAPKAQPVKRFKL